MEMGAPREVNVFFHKTLKLCLRSKEQIPTQQSIQWLNENIWKLHSHLFGRNLIKNQSTERLSNLPKIVLVSGRPGI